MSASHRLSPDGELSIDPARREQSLLDRMLDGLTSRLRRKEIQRRFNTDTSMRSSARSLLSIA
jgi:hypothetical protein